MVAETGQVFTVAEVSKHNKPNDCWLIIDDKVYDVSKFLDEHPGGEDVLLNATGRDATEDFEDVGHSSNARSQMDEFYVGELDMATRPVKIKPTTPPKQQQNNHEISPQFIVKLLQFLLPLIILGWAVGFRFFSKPNTA